MKLSYEDQLNHPNWYELSQRLKRERKMCAKCSSTKNLEVHHKTYKNDRRMAWEYEDSDLEVLCSKCHGAEHGKRKGVCGFSGCERAIHEKFDYCFQHNQEVKRAELEAERKNLEVKHNSEKQELEIREKKLIERQAKLQKAKDDAERQIRQKKLKTEASLIATKNDIKDADKELNKINQQRRDCHSALLLMKTKHSAVLKKLEQKALQNTEKEREAVLKKAEEEKRAVIKSAEKQSDTILKTVAMVVVGLMLFASFLFVMMYQVAKSAISEKSEAQLSISENVEFGSNSSTASASTTTVVAGHLGCPRKACDGTMLMREGSNGKFYGCSKYPECKMTIDHPFLCYKCESKMVLRPGKRGKFWGCSSYPKCKHTNEYRE